MSYTKQTWTDNVSPINAERMNHIEEGVSSAHTEIENIIKNGGSGYVLPPATSDTLGGVKVGEGLRMVDSALGILPDDELIAFAEVTGSDEYSIAIDRDINGNPFDLAKATISYRSPANESDSNVGTNVAILNAISGQMSTDRVATISFGVPAKGTACIAYGQINAVNETVFGAVGSTKEVNGTFTYIYSETNNGKGIKELLLRGTTATRPFIQGTVVKLYGKRR